MLSPIEVHPDPSGEANHILLAWEGFNPDPRDSNVENCITIIAVCESRPPTVPDPMVPSTLREWTSYQAAFNATETPQDERLAYTRSRGNKLPEDVARIMFPRLAGVRYRR